MGKNTDQAQQWLDKYYPDSDPSRHVVEKCFADFKHQLCWTLWSPKLASCSRKHKKIQKMVLADRFGQAQPKKKYRTYDFSDFCIK